MQASKRPPVLTGKQRRQLRGLAHDLDPVVQVGKEGLTDSLCDAVDAALSSHELIKIRVLESAPVGRREAGGQLAEALSAHVVGELGRVVILYRRHPDTPLVPLNT